MNHPLIVRNSPYTVKETADRLAAVLESKNIRIFARINHSVAAMTAGLSLADEEVLVFGDPKVGTYLMQECPAIGIELPLKMVIWKGQQTSIGYTDPMLLLDNYKIKENRAVIEKMSGLMHILVNEVVDEQIEGK